MNCLKCGREIQSPQVFCDACLADMDAYPVKPGTPVHIHHRQAMEKKAVTKAAPSSKELLRKQRKRIQWLWLLIAALGLTASILLLLLLYAWGVFAPIF